MSVLDREADENRIYREINDFLGAIAYIKQRDPSTHIGAMGYSMGAAVTLMGAARTQDVEAVVADSAFASSWSAVELAVHRAFRLRSRLPGWLLTLLYSTTDLLLWWRAGYRFHQVEPYQEVAKIAPRPLLFIHGTNDAIVSLDNAMRLYEAAHFPKYLWLIEGARHTKGYLVDRPAYHQHVLTFFEYALSKASKLRHIWQGSGHQPPFFLPFSSNEINNAEEIENLPTRLPEGESSDFAQSTRKVLKTSRQKDNNHPVPPELMQSSSGGFHEPRKKERYEVSHRPGTLWLAYGRLAYRWRWFIVILWALVLLTAVPFARSVPSVLHNRGYTIPTSESIQVSDILATTFHQPTTLVLVVFQSVNTPVADPAYQHELEAFLKRMKTFPHVVSATQGEIGRDKRSTFVALGFDQDQDTVASHIPDLRQMLATQQQLGLLGHF